jgi:hypothetical protein
MKSGFFYSTVSISRLHIMAEKLSRLPFLLPKMGFFFLARTSFGVVIPF